MLVPVYTTCELNKMVRDKMRKSKSDCGEILDGIVREQPVIYDVVMYEEVARYLGKSYEEVTRLIDVSKAAVIKKNLKDIVYKIMGLVGKRRWERE